MSGKSNPAFDFSEEDGIPEAKLDFLENCRYLPVAPEGALKRTLNCSNSECKTPNLLWKESTAEPETPTECPKCGSEIVDVGEEVEDDSKSPNRSENWPGPTIRTWSPNGEGCYTYEEKEKVAWHRWGIVDWNGPERLLIIDIDLYKIEDEERKKEITEAVSELGTRTHKSQSGGIHSFFLVDPKNLTEKGRLPVSLNTYIDDKLNGYVLDPECKGYEVQIDREPVKINPRTDLPNEWLKDGEKDGKNGSTTETGPLDDEELEERLETALEKDEKFKHLWKGEYEKAGFGDDRSRAEASLASKIGFWFGRNEETIKKLMGKSASPKWHKRDDRSYRDSIIKAGLQGEETYQAARRSVNEVRRSLKVGKRNIEIGFEDLSRKNNETRGTFYAKVSENEYIDQDWKLSRRNVSTFVSDLADREGLDKGEENTVGRQLDELKTEAIKLAKKSGGSEGEKEKENLFEEETIPEEYRREAKEVIEKARILPAILQVYEIPHIWDYERKLFLFCSQVSKPLTGKTLNDQSVGTSGKGKSHLQRIMANGVPNEYKLVRDSISAKYLYYLTDDYGSGCLANKLLFYDDVTLDEEKEATLKTVTDPGPTDEATHGTVKDQERLDLKLAGLPIVWLNSVDTFSSEQLRNRFFVDQPDESTELDKEVSQFQREEGRRGDLHPERKVDYCKAKALYKEVVEGGISDLEVLIPYDWEWKAESDRRIQPLFLNLVHIITKLNYAKRLKRGDHIFSTLEDFYLAKLVMNKFLRQTVGKMTDKMTAIWEAVADYRGDSNIRADIAEETGLGEGAVRYQLDQKKGGSLTDLGFVNREKKDNKWHYWKTEKEPVKTCATLSQASQSWDGLKEQFKEVLTACETFHDESDVAHMYGGYKKHVCANPSILEKVSQVIWGDEEGLYSLIDVESSCETVSQLFTASESSGSLEEDLKNILKEEVPKPEDFPFHFEGEELVSVNNILLTWKTDGTAYIDDDGRWQLND